MKLTRTAFIRNRPIFRSMFWHIRRRIDHVGQLVFTTGALLGVGLSWATEGIAFKSSRLEISPAEFLSQNPEFHCPLVKSAVLDCRSQSTTYAGIIAIEAIATFLKGRLSQVQLLLFKSGDDLYSMAMFDRVAEAISAKYGIAERGDSISSSLTRTIRVWKSDHAQISLVHSKGNSTTIVAVEIGWEDHLSRAVKIFKSETKSDI